MEYTGFIQDHDSSLTQKNLGGGDDNLSDLPLCFISVMEGTFSNAASCYI